MAEDGIPEILAEHRLGHEVPGMRGLYAHTSDRMREDLKLALQARWEESLRERAALHEHSPVPLLDELLARSSSCQSGKASPAGPRLRDARQTRVTKDPDNSLVWPAGCSTSRIEMLSISIRGLHHPVLCYTLFYGDHRRDARRAPRCAGGVDQIHFKLFAMVDQAGGRHEADLRALRPSAAELVAAARWSLTQDPSPGYQMVLVEALRALGVEDADLGA